MTADTPSARPPTSEQGTGTVSLGASTAALVLITLAVKLLGFGEKQVIAYYFGTGDQVDAYFVAVSVVIGLFLLVRELVEPAFLPLFVQHLDSGDRRRAWQLVTAVAVAVLCVCLPVVTTGGLLATRLAAVLAPGFSAATLALTGTLLRITIAGGLLLGLSALSSITLNGYRRFALPASGDLVLKAAPVVAALLLARSLGIVALALGLLAGCAGRLLVHLGGLARELRWLAWPRGKSRDDLRRLAWLTAPLLLGVLCSQLSALADNHFASQVGSGAVAARTYAQKIVDLPVLLLPYALSVVIFPHLASLAARQERARLLTALARCVRGLTVLFAYLSVATMILAGPIVTLLLERGAFDAAARVQTAWPLQLYAAGLVSFAVEALVVPYYFALGDTRTPVLLGIAGVVVNIGLTATLIGPLGIGGVALALSLSKSLKLIALGLLLKRKHPGLRLQPALGFLGRVGAVAAISAGGMALLTRLVAAPAAVTPLLQQAAYLVLVAGLGGLLFAGLLLGLAPPERRLLVAGWQTVRHLGRELRWRR